MGAEVTLCGPPTLIPRGIEELGCAVAHSLDGLEEADVVYALRMQRERMAESFVPSIREYAAHFQIDSRRLGPRQLLMHPGPVNRGVELSGEVIDSPQSLMTEQVASGLVVRMAILYELLAASGERPAPGPDRRRAAPSGRPRSGSLHEREPRPTALDMRSGEGADVVLREATLLDPVAGIEGVHDVVIRDGRIAELAAPGSASADGVEVVEAAGLHAFPAFFDPHVHLRTPGHEHKEDVETGTRAAAAGGYCGVIAMANTEPPVSDRGRRRGAARGGARGRLGADRLPGDGDQRHGGRGADRDGGAARGRARSASATTACRSAAPGCCAGRSSTSGSAAARSPSTRRTPSSPAPASCTRARSPRCSAWPASRRSRSRR